jgi:hypothetical protein
MAFLYVHNRLPASFTIDDLETSEFLLVKRSRDGYALVLLCKEGRVILRGKESSYRGSADSAFADSAFADSAFADMIAEMVCEAVESKETGTPEESIGSGVSLT